MFFSDRTLDSDGDLFLILADKDEGGDLDNTSKDDKNNTNPRTFQVQCSSKHLTLALSVFKAMLAGNFRERALLKSAGTLRLCLPDDDSPALLILLAIIHGQTKEIPDYFKLRMLTRIAVVVDKYQLHMAVAFHSHIWVNHLKATIPRDLTMDVYRWIFVSWVFRCPTTFKLTTKIAERQSMSRIDHCDEIDLPIPSSIGGQWYLTVVVSLKADSFTGAIDRHRQEAILGIVGALHRLQEEYIELDMTCTKRCNFMVLGSFVKAVHSLKLSNSPEAVCHNISFDRFAFRVQYMSVMTDSQCPKERCKNLDHRDGLSKVRHSIVDIIKAFEEKLCGLDLDIMDCGGLERT